MISLLTEKRRVQFYIEVAIRQRRINVESMTAVVKKREIQKREDKKRNVAGKKKTKENAKQELTVFI